MFSESSMSALSKKFKMGSIGIPSKILVSPLTKFVATGQSSLKMYLFLYLLEEFLLNLPLGSSVAQNKNFRSDFYIMLTSHFNSIVNKL